MIVNCSSTFVFITSKKIKLMKTLLLTCGIFAIMQSASAQTSWLLNGNSGTGTTHAIGTTDSKDLRFKTGNSTRMTLRSSGQLGINVTPETRSRLYINDNAPSGAILINSVYASAKGSMNNSSGTLSANGYMGVYYTGNGSLLNSIPSTLKYAGVMGIKEDDSNRGAGVVGWNKNSQSGGTNYGVYGLANGVETGIVGVDDRNIGVYGSASGSVTNIAVMGWSPAAGDYAAHFTGRGYFSDRVGIGTENPSALLHLNGTGELLRMNAAAPSLSLSVNNVAKGFMQASGNNVNIGLSGGNSSGNLYFYANNTARMTMLNNGNLGLGTTSPSAKLQVHTTTEAIGIRGTNAFIQFYNGSNQARSYIQGLANDLKIGTSTGNTSGDIILSTAGGDAIRITETAQVRIGTSQTAAGYKLAVGGKVICEEVKVQLQGNWPDYVFADDYNLMPIETLKAHVAEKNHLPGMAPASEIEADGNFNLGELQKKLLEKVEELTLYVIQLHDENKNLKSEIQNIKSSR